MAKLVFEGESEILRSYVERLDIGGDDAALSDAPPVELHREAQAAQEHVDDFPRASEVFVCQFRLEAVSVE